MPSLVRYGIVLTLFIYYNELIPPHVILHFSHPPSHVTRFYLPNIHNTNIYPLFHTITHTPLHNMYVLLESHIFTPNLYIFNPDYQYSIWFRCLPICPLLCCIIYILNGASQPTGLKKCYIVLYFLYFSNKWDNDSSPK